jgi:hypothetical protein
MAPGDPGAGPDGQRLGRLLRWYPRAWRERYGGEFLALVEDTLDGRRPGWRLRLAVAWSGLRERGRQARPAGGQVLPGLARGLAADSGSAFIVAGYLLAILPNELGASPARPAGLGLDVLTALIALAGLALLAGGLAMLPALVRLMRASGRPRIRVEASWAAAATATAGAGLAWIIGWPGTSSLAPLDTPPAYLCVLLATALALTTALDRWTAMAAAVARRLELAPRVRAAERALVAVALPAILIMVGADVVWYSAATSSVFWLTWGLMWFLWQGQRAIGEIRRGRTG